jgi:DnaJ-class molecular chaperone
MPRKSCQACRGIGSVRLTAHLYQGDREFEAPCWECFGEDVKIDFPHPTATDN